MFRFNFNYLSIFRQPLFLDEFNGLGNAEETDPQLWDQEEVVSFFFDRPARCR